MRETDNLPPHLKAGDKVILFDGVCKLCSAWTHFIIRYDQAQIFKLCSVQSPVGQALLQHFGYPTDVYDTMLYVDGKRSYDKGDAFLAIIGQFNYPW